MVFVDLSQVKELPVIADGVYEATVSDFKEFKTKSKNEDAVAVTFTIGDDSAPEAEGRKLFRNYTLTEKAMWAFKQLVGYAGGSDELFEGPMSVADIMNAVLGGKVRIEVGNRMYEGRLSNEVRRVLPLVAGESW